MDIKSYVSPDINDLIYENRSTLASASASFVSTIAGFPLDSVKSRLQVKRYSSILDCISTTYKDEGMKGFFRGVYIPLLTITLVRTASFTIYTSVKQDLMKRKLLKPDSLQNVAALGLAGGGVSGMILSCGTAPFEYLIAVQTKVPHEDIGTLKSFRQIYRTGGVQALYTGFPLQFARDCLGTGLYFSLYDSSRYIIDNSTNNSGIPIPRFVSTFFCGAGAGILSWTLIYPIDLVKAKVQRNALANHPVESPFSIFCRLSNGGVSRLYRGLGVSALRSIASHGLMWTILEAVRGEIEQGTGHTRD